MKETEYADSLILDYMMIKQQGNQGWSGMNLNMAIKCAIIDVTNTLNSFKSINCQIPINDKIYYENVLQILKNK